MSVDIKAQANKIAEFVKAFNEEHGRGCPTFQIQAFMAQNAIPGNALKVAKEHNAKTNPDGLGLIEGGRGKEGGFFLSGEKPESQVSDPSLKADMVNLLRAYVNGEDIDNDMANSCIARYDAEIEKRKIAQQERRAKASAN